MKGKDGASFDADVECVIAESEVDFGVLEVRSRSLVRRRWQELEGRCSSIEDADMPACVSQAAGASGVVNSPRPL